MALYPVQPRKLVRWRPDKQFAEFFNKLKKGDPVVNPEEEAVKITKHAVKNNIETSSMAKTYKKRSKKRVQKKKRTVRIPRKRTSKKKKETKKSKKTTTLKFDKKLAKLFFR